MATYGPTTEPEEIDFTVAAPGLQWIEDKKYMLYLVWS